MSFSTSPARWAKAVLMDTFFAAALIAGWIYGVPYIASVAVFVLWWTTALGFIVIGALLCVGPITQAIAENSSAKTAAEGFELRDKIWSGKARDTLAVSDTYLTYHWITDLGLIFFLVAMGHPVLASFRLIVFLMSCVAIGVARKLKIDQADRAAQDAKDAEFLEAQRKAMASAGL